MPIHKGTYHKRTIDKVHILVRLELANPLISQSDIARLGGISPASFVRLKNLPIWKTIHNQYMSGVVSRLDVQIEDNYKLGRETLNFAVPVALQNLVQQALNAKDERVKNKAINDILDRDGRFAKVTRVGLATAEQGGVGDAKDNQAAAEMLNALKNAQKPTISSPPVTDIEQ